MFIPAAKGSSVPKLLACAALASACLFAALPALAQSAWAVAQLKDMDAAFGKPVEGMTFEGAVPKGATGAIKLSLPAGGRYAVVGACGGDCTDIGLILDKDGKAVAQGVTGFKSTLPAGEYELKVGFDNCKDAQCRYVVRVYPAG